MRITSLIIIIIIIIIIVLTHIGVRVQPKLLFFMLDASLTSNNRNMVVLQQSLLIFTEATVVTVLRTVYSPYCNLYGSRKNAFAYFGDPGKCG